MYKFAPTHSKSKTDYECWTSDSGSIYDEMIGLRQLMPRCRGRGCGLKTEDEIE